MGQKISNPVKGDKRSRWVLTGNRYFENARVGMFGDLRQTSKTQKEAARSARIVIS